MTLPTSSGPCAATATNSGFSRILVCVKQEQPIGSIPAIDEPPDEIIAVEPGPDEVMTAGEIRERMATVRQQIHDRSDQVVTQTKELSDWRFYVRRHPWASVTAAAVIGYAIVPGRPKTGEEGSISDIDDPSAASGADELKSVLLGAAKRAAVAHVSRALGDLVSGFCIANDEE